MTKKNQFNKVDVWRSSFGEVSVKAIYALFREKSGCTHQELKKITFRDMVEYLRKMEDPTYRLTHVINI